MVGLKIQQALDGLTTLIDQSLAILSESENQAKDILGDQPIHELDLHYTGEHSLKNDCKMEYLWQVAAISPRELETIRNMGTKNSYQTLTGMAEFGIKLRETPHPIELLESTEADWKQTQREAIARIISHNAYSEDDYHTRRDMPGNDPTWGSEIARHLYNLRSCEIQSRYPKEFLLSREESD